MQLTGNTKGEGLKMTLDARCERVASPLKTTSDWLQIYRTIPKPEVGTAIHKYINRCCVVNVLEMSGI